MTEHYCIICKQVETCKDLECDFTIESMAHFECLYELSPSQKVIHNHVVKIMIEQCSSMQQLWKPQLHLKYQ